MDLNIVESVLGSVPDEAVASGSQAADADVGQEDSMQTIDNTLSNRKKRASEAGMSKYRI
jgi:hypothetical protein